MTSLTFALALLLMGLLHVKKPARDETASSSKGMCGGIEDEGWLMYDMYR